MSIEFIMAANELKEVESLRKSLEESLTKLIQKVGKVSIGKLEQFPFGWRKAAKGRTVWRIIEELITQNLEVHHNEFGISKVTASDSEVSVYDMINFYNEDPNHIFMIATFLIKFNKDMSIELTKAVVMPIAWIPDLYVNPSNNGNLQSSYAKDLNKAKKRTNATFIEELKKEIQVAEGKKKKRSKKGRSNDLP